MKNIKYTSNNKELIEILVQKAELLNLKTGDMKTGNITGFVVGDLYKVDYGTHWDKNSKVDEDWKEVSFEEMYEHITNYKAEKWTEVLGASKCQISNLGRVKYGCITLEEEEATAIFQAWFCHGMDAGQCGIKTN